MPYRRRFTRRGRGPRATNRWVIDGILPFVIGVGATVFADMIASVPTEWAEGNVKIERIIMSYDFRPLAAGANVMGGFAIHTNDLGNTAMLSDPTIEDGKNMWQQRYHHFVDADAGAPYKQIAIDFRPKRKIAATDRGLLLVSKNNTASGASLEIQVDWRILLSK